MRLRNIVLLYGIPQNPLTDQSYDNYFTRVLREVEEGETIYVGGGATDPGRPMLTEAGVAVEMLRKLNYTGTVIASETGLDVQGVFKNLSDNLKKSPVRIFCAYTHKDLVEFLVRRHFSDAQVITLPFPAELAEKPAKSMYLRAMRIPRTLLGIAGVYVPWARRFEQLLRARHMRKMATPRRDV